MTHDLPPLAPQDGFWLKFARANEHFEALKDEVERFIESNPYVLIRHFEMDPGGDVGHHSLRIQVRDAPPARWSLILGDCLHNLRSSLDHLIWDLSFRTSGDSTLRTEFPIFHSRGEYHRLDNRSGQPTSWSGLHKVRYVPAMLQMVIE